MKTTTKMMWSLLSGVLLFGCGESEEPSRDAEALDDMTSGVMRDMAAVSRDDGVIQKPDQASGETDMSQSGGGDMFMPKEDMFMASRDMGAVGEDMSMPKEDMSAQVDMAKPPGKFISTASLGWKAGENVTQKFKTALGMLKPGEGLYFDELYGLDDERVQIPDDVTLAAKKGGGFRLLGVKDSNGEYLRFGNRTKLVNFTITDEGFLDNVSTNNKTTLVCDDKDDVEIIDSLIEGYAKLLLDVRGCDKMMIRGTHFRYSFLQVRLLGTVEDFTMEKSLMSDSEGDGIKTVQGPNSGTVRAKFIDTVFERQGRDGIDTTGGLKNSVVKGCIFRDSFAGMDIKDVFENRSQMGKDLPQNTGIVVEDTDFVDNNNALVLTTLDRCKAKAQERGEPNPQHCLNDGNAAEYMPHDILVKNSRVEKTKAGGRGPGQMWLIKDAHTISWDNIQLLGDATEARIFKPGENASSRPVLSPSKTNYNLKGTNVTRGPERAAALPYPFATVGPK